VQAAARLARPLISAEELAERLKVGPPAVLDVRWALGGPPGRAEYEKGHIPGALFVDLDTELAAPPGAGGRHPLPDADAFGASMRAAGVRGDRQVVVYDAATSMAAARLWWLLRYFGHPEVTVLDGGLGAWVAAGYPISTEAPAVESGEFEARPGAMPVLDPAGAAELAQHGVLLDARAAERFRGEHEPVDPVAGHIPCARNRPTSENVGPDGRFLERAALRAAFERAGAREGVEVGAYCGSGVTAAHEVLALEVAGFHAALYPGSWSEWITDPSRPVATSD
jgi:thiosulfate/3-mercaptopyruvate sulfurtransferase